MIHDSGLHFWTTLYFLARKLNIVILTNQHSWLPQTKCLVTPPLRYATTTPQRVRPPTICWHEIGTSTMLPSPPRPVEPERIWKWRGTRTARSDGKIFFVMPLHFLGSKSSISRFRQYSWVSFLFAVLLLTVPLCQSICKSVGHVPPPPCLMESAPLTHRGHQSG